MKSNPVVFVVVFILFSNLLACQVFENPVILHGHLIKTIEYKDSLTEKIYKETIEIKNSDTIKYYNYSNRYELINEKGIKIVEGHAMGGMGTECGCEPKPHGEWIERYPNGILKSIGQFQCGNKTGKWVYFFENGNIYKIENYKLAYPDILTQNQYEWDTLPKQRYLLSDTYQEYYPNGQIKVDGNYSIIEVHSIRDTLITFDPDTYNEIKQEIKGSFWLPKSEKVGLWTKYNKNGRVISSTEYTLSFDYLTTRPISTRFVELIQK